MQKQKKQKKQKKVETNKTQTTLFDTIQQQLTGNVALAAVLQDTLNLSDDSVYRRMRGETLLNLSEIEKLYRHFNISIDALLGSSANNLLFRQAPVNADAIESFRPKLIFMVELMETFAANNNCDMIYSSVDIPFFHYAQFPELMLFRIYVWHQSIYKYNPMSFEEFLKIHKSAENEACFKRIADAAKKIPLTEIWSPNMLSSLLNHMDYYRDLEQFTDKVTLTLLCNQTLDLIEYIRKCIESSYQKWDKKEIPFNLYLSSVDLPNDLMLTRQNDTKTVSFMLFFISSIHSANTALCKETETWLKDQMSKSLYMNGAPEKERIKFFSKLKEKVLRLYE